MTAETQRPTCVVTGTTGYLGSRVKAALERAGWRVKGLNRHPLPGGDDVAYRLGDLPAPESLEGATALIHCSYDLRAISPGEIRAVNVQGSEKLLESAHRAGVPRLIYISSMSAFPGCHSLYGQAKLAIEKLALARRAMVIRPGLIYGVPPAGMFGRLVKQVEQANVLPLFGRGDQVLHLVHDEDASEVLVRCANGTLANPGKPVTLAHEQPWTFRQILEEIARSRSKRLKFVSLPWRLVWAGLKTAEACGLRLGFRSDSLVSLVHPNPQPAFEWQRQLTVPLRPFELKPARN